MSWACSATYQVSNVHDDCQSISDKLRSPCHLPLGYSSTGYNFSNLIRASSVVNLQRTLASRRFRSDSHAPTSRIRKSTSSIRRSRHWPERTLNSVSAMFSQLPCLCFASVEMGQTV